MKKEAKTKLTCEKIIQAAIAEFGTKTYEAASLNTICSENQISKGLIYHNFKNKDELYLVCVRQCYDKMTEHIKAVVCDAEDIQGKIKQLLNGRQRFFEENPYDRQIFFNSILTPPDHVVKDLRQLRQGYDECVRGRYRELLSQIELREGVSVDKAVDYLMVFQEMYNSYFRSMDCKNEDMNTLIEIHENRLSEMLDITLYGLIEKKNTGSEQ